MATDARSNAPVKQRPASNAKNSIVEQRIATARRQLRLVDLASGVALLAICLLGYFLLLALVEHWLVPLGTAARYAAWATLLLGGGYFLVARLLPAIIRPINPIYAARTIEQGNSTLKNSLINYLLFRHRQSEVLPVVYQALEQQASEGAARVSPETVVDRSGLIKLGYVLVVSLALFGAYEVGSPKDALQTAQRVILPWADIAPPTRVTISEVTPGNAQAYRGFSVAIAADVRGLREGEQVTLLYSTADGQIVDQPIELERESATGYRFTGALPASGGVMQNLSYRITAGDGTTPDYTITALNEPTVVISRVEYQPPKYTGREPSTDKSSGDLKALEQTLVTLHAEANYPLESGTIEFDPDTTDKPRSRRLTVNENKASVSFHLELDSDRKGAKYRTYQLRIVTTDKATNAQPILHTIEVVPDLTPEVEILTPNDRLVELPQDSRLPIEARAIDPDFGLSALELRANQGGKSLLNETLLAGDQQLRQHRGEYVLEPLKLGLPVGAEVVYWAEAADNRTQQPEGSPAPNQAKTGQYRIRITPPTNPPQQQQGEGEGESDPSNSSNNDPSAEGDPNNSDESNSGESNSAEGEGEASEEGKQGGAEGAGDQTGEGNSDAGEDQQGGGAGGESQQEGELGEGEGDERAGQGSNANGPEGADQEGTGGQQSQGAGGTKPGDQSGGQQGESGGTEPGANSQSSGRQGGDRGEGESPQQAGGDNSRPLDSEGAEDAEAFKRAQEFFEEQQEKQQQAGGGQEDAAQEGEGEQSPNSADDTANADPQNSASKQESSEGEGQERQAAGGNNDKPGDDQSASGENPSGDPQGADDMRPEEAGGAGEQEPAERNGGQGDTGDSGAGKASDDDSGGPPEAQGENRDKPKNRSDSGEGDPTQEEAESPSISKEQSDSEGERGDRSGGGGEGGGQVANQEGNDSPGSNSAADEGAGAANESGEGETSEGPGSKQEAEGQTGQSGEQPGGGSRNQAGEEGTQPGEGQTNNQLPGEASEQPSDPNNSGGQPRQGPEGNSPSRQGGGAPGRPQGNDVNFTDDDIPPADEVNLDYARKATDLVLDKLEQQADQPNQELLDRLGWTPEQLEQFVSRWKAMKAQSQQAGPTGEEAQQELDDALQSLGLVPEASRHIETNDDRIGGSRDAGFRSQPPAAYQRLYDAFRKSGG